MSHPELPQHHSHDDPETAFFTRYEQEFSPIDLDTQQAFMRDTRQDLDDKLQQCHTKHRIADALPDLLRDAPWNLHFCKYPSGAVTVEVEYSSAMSYKPMRKVLPVLSFDDVGEPRICPHFTPDDLSALDSYFTRVDTARDLGMLPSLKSNYRLPVQ